MAMADGRADLAVHSLKDVPMDMPDGFALAADHRARGPARCVRVESLSRPRGPARRRAGRHVEPAPRGAAARARSAALHPAAARQRQHAAAQARRRAIRRDHPRRGGVEAPRSRRADRLLPRSGRKPARGRAGRARASNAGPIAPIFSPRSRRSPIATRRSRRRRSAPSRARCREAATRRSPRTRCSSTTSCGCADCSRAATAAK